MFASAPSTIVYVKTGKLRALAVTTTKRSKALADVSGPRSQYQSAVM
jgi:tripartite-type tricarboxylate transporter receptor subunit TctC